VLGDQPHRGLAHEDLPVKPLAPGERRDVTIFVDGIFAISRVELLVRGRPLVFRSR
jgi:hypothetical protein